MSKLRDEYNNSYHHSIGKTPLDADYSAMTKKIEMNPKTNKFTVGNRVKITKYKNIFSKSYSEVWSKEIFVIDSVLRTNP